jgi:hypothetical protein
VLAFDNLSDLTPWLSDRLCRLATGSGFATRELFSDDDEVIFSATRPVILNGISEVVTRSDLLDRSLVLTFPTIPDALRRDERGLLRDFTIARAGILGGLLDAVSSALRHLAGVRLARAPSPATMASSCRAATIGLPSRHG